MAKISFFAGAAVMTLALSGCMMNDGFRDNREYNRTMGEKTAYGYSDRYCPPAQARKNRCYHPWYSHRLPHSPDYSDFRDNGRNDGKRDHHKEHRSRY